MRRPGHYSATVKGMNKPRHALPEFAAQASADPRWPIILTADGVPVAHVTDDDTAETALDLAAQISGEGFDPADAIRRALQDHLPDGSEGRTAGTAWPGWIDHLDYDADA